MLQLRATIPILLFAFLLLSTGCSSTSDDANSVIASDSTFRARMDSTWAQIRRYRDQGAGAKSDSLQRVRATEFFQYYVDHPKTDVGRKAAQGAFMMWGNLGADKKVEEAVTHIDHDSKLWSRILHFVGNAYARSDRQSDYVAFLQSVEPKLTHPRSKSVALLQLARHHQSNKEREEVKSLYRRVVDLDADSFFVDKALSKLYEMESLQVGQKAPGFESTTLSGETISLSDLRGKVVVLEFWATWCGPCMPEIPHLKALWSDYQDEEFALVGISLDQKTDKLKQFIEQKSMTWPQIQESEKWDGKLAKKYSVLGIPKSYIIDRTGTIVARDLSENKLEAKVQKLMSAGQG